MVSVLASSVVDHGFKPPSGQTKGYTIGICCFSAKHAALRKKSKDWLVWNQDNVYRWVDMSIGGLLFQWASTIKIRLSVLVLYKADNYISKCPNVWVILDKLSWTLLTMDKCLIWSIQWNNLSELRGYHTLQGDNSLKSVECFDHMMFVCRFQASRWSKPQREKLLVNL
jgi:hypothetical protein